jgi:hypothetical protein
MGGRRGHMGGSRGVKFKSYVTLRFEAIKHRYLIVFWLFFEVVWHIAFRGHKTSESYCILAIFEVVW